MKKYNLFLYLVVLALTMVACFKTPGTDILFDKEYPEFDLLGKGGAEKNKAQKGYAKAVDGVSVKDTFFITYSSRTLSNPINIGYTVSPISRNAVGDTIKAIEGTHYRLAPTGTVVVPAGNVFKTNIPFEIIDDNLQNGKVYVFNIKITTPSGQKNDGLSQMDFIFRLCPFTINSATFLGLYKCLEPGYNAQTSGSPNANPDGTYKVTFTQINATTIRANNFWDSGWSVDYVFDDNAKTVRIVTTVQSGTTIESNGNGTYDACTGRFVVPYKLSGANVETNTHTFFK